MTKSDRHDLGEFRQVMSKPAVTNAKPNLEQLRAYINAHSDPRRFARLLLAAAALIEKGDVKHAEH